MLIILIFTHFYSNKNEGDEISNEIYDYNDNNNSLNQLRMNSDNNLLALRHIELQINVNHYRILLEHGGIHEVRDEIFVRHLDNSYLSSTETLETIFHDADSSSNFGITTDLQSSYFYLMNANNSDSITFRSTEKKREDYSNFIDKTIQFLYKKAEDVIYDVGAIKALPIKNWFNIIEVTIESFMKPKFLKTLNF
uniref:Uncharacterized protein n=1 Tax=Strongyloides venezuelensis TaxID=75913 RepID=A0A0K0EVJ1_STRVS